MSEEVIETKVDDTKVEITPKEVKVETPKEDEKSPTQYRVERAERQTEERILKSLGVDSLDEITKKLNETQTLREEMDALKKDKVRGETKSNLMAKLVAEDVFDPEVLMYMVDLDEVENTDEGLATVVEALKAKKPNFFGVRTLSGDDHKTSKKQSPSNPVEELAKSGDYQGSIAAFLRGDK